VESPDVRQNTVSTGAAPESQRGGLAPWQLSQVATYIEANLTRTIRISDLAANIRLSASYFYQAFKRSAGVSPYAYIIRRRIKRAQELMLRTDLPLSEIALNCGLADQPHLTRQFRNIVGTSPAAWRRLAYKKTAADFRP
jgi:AraC family transcriptional regulator